MLNYMLPGSPGRPGLYKMAKYLHFTSFSVVCILRGPGWVDAATKLGLADNCGLGLLH